MINENRDKINRIITNVSWSGDNQLQVKRYDNSITISQLDGQIPSLNELLTTNKNFVVNKKKKIYAQNINAAPIVGVNAMDILELTDKSKFLFDGSKWIKIQKSTVELSESIRIPLYKSGKLYRKKDIVKYNDKIYLALSNTKKSPVSAFGSWRLITEYNMFVNICETVPSKLNGLFTVSDNNYIQTVFNPNSLLEYKALFSGNMIPSSSNNYQYMDFIPATNGVRFTGWRSGFPERLYSTADDYIDSTVKRITGTLEVNTDTIGSGEFRFIGWNRNLGGYQDTIAKTIDINCKNDSLQFAEPIGATGSIFIKNNDPIESSESPFGFVPSGVVDVEFDIDMTIPNGTTNLGIICNVDASVNEQDSIFHALKNLYIHREVIDNG